MSGVLCSFVGGSFGPSVPEVIGEAFGGGFYGGKVNDGGTEYYLIVAPKSSGENSTGDGLQWKTSETTTSGTTSVVDGPSNTSAMISAGAAAHPCGNFCNNLSIGGFTDWYMPAQNELDILYFNLKPTTASNSSESLATNPNAVPARTSAYTSGDPSQTSVTAYQTGNAEAFLTDRNYWASTERDGSGGDAKRFTFFDGAVANGGKTQSFYVRAVRRIPV